MFWLRPQQESMPHAVAEKPPAPRLAPWVRGLLTLAIVLLLIAGMIEGYRRVVDRYATRVVETQSEKIAVTAKLMNTPPWLDAGILNSIIGETAALAQRDLATYDRFRNPLDQDILREIHDNYLATDQNGVNHWAKDNNAWIKKITRIERVISPDRKSQVIEIFAEYRKPAAWVESAGKCYLIDDQRVRLPGVYTLAERKASGKLMMINGVDLPPGDTGAPAVPVPSKTWDTDDLAAAMTLLPLLQNQPYAPQILAIDMTNFQGRKDKLQPWIALDTDRVASDGSASRVLWGRPPGKTTFYDISDAAKLKALSMLFLKYNRIDAGYDFVDIHTEQVMVPSATAQNDPAAGSTAVSQSR
ncbi:MAG TPA: hypothetical protein VH253_20385 [Phycisphaerae bacterium]|nr:hypothetical protein [Phycisphaerae bacterium]